MQRAFFKATLKIVLSSTGVENIGRPISDDLEIISDALKVIPDGLKVISDDPPSCSLVVFLQIAETGRYSRYTRYAATKFAAFNI